jgi:hypothetical protein
MAPLCSTGEGSTHRKCPGVDTRSVRRASGLLETLGLYRDCPETRLSVECAFLGAVTIEPFEVSRWRGGCGTVYGIWMGMCLGRRCFLREKLGKQRAGDGMG